jgi:fructokinase
MIVVVGEALIDLIDEHGRLAPHPGGGPFNTAVALGHLGAPVGFLGRLSRDRFGELLAARLAQANVDDRYLLRGPAPTPLAMVHEKADGDHEFTFYLSGTAYADLRAADLPDLDVGVVAICAGTLALATDPPAAAIELLLEREAQRRVIIIDPNVRPAVIANREVFRRRFERFASLAHVVKLSDADASWLYPDEQLEAILEKVLECGAQLVVLTLGAAGARARTRGARCEVPALAVDVVDTVGAGDAFLAGLLRWLWLNERLTPDAIGKVGAGELADGLGFAAIVGALQCARAGAEPPTLAEVDAFASLPL